MRWTACAVLMIGCGGSPAPDTTWTESVDPSSPEASASDVAPVIDSGTDSADEVWAMIDNTNYGITPPPAPGPAPIPTQTVPAPVPDAAPSLPFGQCTPSCMSNDECNVSCPRRNGVWCCTAGTCSPFTSGRCP